MYTRKRKKEGERLIREAGKARTENKVWEIVNRGRRKRKEVDKGIQMREWKQYFRRWRVLRGSGRGNRRVQKRDLK